jgi:transposase
MLLRQEEWMELRRFKALKEAGATYAEIARATGRDWRTVKKYLDANAPALPRRLPVGSRAAARSPRSPR